MFRQLKKGSRAKYIPELRSFALTLNFYSTAAYQYVRRIFGSKSLPHIRTLSKWYSCVDGTPGFSAQAITAIKNKVAFEGKKGKKVVGGLVMDEMSIREHVQWTGSRHVGYVNFGTGLKDSDILPKAKNVLVLMVVGYNCRWKVPVAYFLIDSLSGEEKANLVKNCLYQLESTGILIKSLTFDGCASNMAMAHLLGANLHFPGIKSFFLNPTNKEKIYIILDACHMVKLVRNTLGDWGILHDSNGKIIKWAVFNELVKLQNESGLHCATRIRSRHISYTKEKMKVKLAVQTFSSSVADALEYCDKDLNIKSFEDSQGTVEFCRNMNDIFDLLNTRNALSKLPYKRPLFKDSEDFLKTSITNFVTYLSSLNGHNGKNILLSNRKTGFLGLIVCLLSVQGLFDDLIKTETLKFLLTYKLSQDHLEMFFGCIRQRGGFSNNPTAWQFENAFKRILVHSEISCSDSANCLAQDNTSILNISSNSYNRNTLDSLEDNFELSDDMETSFILNHNKIINSMYLSDVTEYIAGFVSRKLINSINCNVCAGSLSNETSMSMLLNKKNRGGLCKPSKDVVNVCLVAETIMRMEQNFSASNIILKLIALAINALNMETLFTCLSRHCQDQDPLNGHILQLIRLILKHYFTIRLHHINSSQNEIKDRIRQKLTKTILFRHQ